MKINRSVLIAFALCLIMAIWFFVNNKAEDRQKTQPTPPLVSEEQAPLPTVVVSLRESELHQTRYTLFGRTEANREVQVKAETVGLVKSVPVEKGTYVKRGTTLCRQDINARQAVLDQAKAQFDARQLDYNAARQLVDKGFSSETQAQSAKAALDAARASVKQAEIELDNVIIRAPFSGVFEDNLAEVGDFLSPGMPCGLLVDLDPLIIAAELTEAQVGGVNVGKKANITLATGEVLEGTVTQVESRANAATRTFRTEIAVPNKDRKLKAGVSATVSLQAGEVMAISVPSNVLALNDDGVLGVRYVDGNNIVRFAQTRTIDDNAQGTWVTGLPDKVRVITLGQDFVAEGVEVNPSVNGATR